MSGQMEQLVDAFKGLAMEGNTGNYLADVEAIVNNYFVQNADDDNELDEDGTSMPNESPIKPRGGNGDISVSPVKEVSCASSGGSLRAWGVAPEVEEEAHQQPDESAETEDFYSRSVGWRQRRSVLRDKKKHANEERDLEDCTWKPSINDLPYTTMGRVVHGKVEDRLHAAAAVKEERLQQQRRAAKENETDGCTFKPRVNRPPVSVQSKYMDDVYASAPRDRSALSVNTTSDPFERLYAARKKKEEPKPANSAPILYTTFSPSRHPKGSKTQVNLNLSLDEIEATERELHEIEVLLNERLKHNSCLVVDSNYIDSDEDQSDEQEDDESSGYTKIDFDTFLLRQNAFEERKRANLAFIEADTAPKLHPRIQPRSRKLRKPSMTSTTRPGADQKEARLKKLSLECWELRNDISKLQEECDSLWRKVAVLTQNKERPSTLSELRSELNSIRLHSSTEEREGDIKINPTDERLKKAFLTKTVEKFLQRTMSGKQEKEKGEVLQGWVREMLDAKTGLMEMKVRSTKLRDALTVEKGNYMGAKDGCIPWETMVKMEFKRTEGTKTEQGEKATPGKSDAQVGDKVMARREDWQAWEKGTLQKIEGNKAVVLLNGTSKAQTFPATRANVIVQPDTGHRFKPALRQQYLQTCIKTREVVKVYSEGKEHLAKVLGQAGQAWMVGIGHGDPSGLLRVTRKITVSEDAIKTSKDAIAGENYGPGNLGGYIQSVAESQKRQDEKRTRKKQEREIRDTLECTYTPHINVTPQYITRIANSMQLLRGETTK